MLFRWPLRWCDNLKDGFIIICVFLRWTWLLLLLILMDLNKNRTVLLLLMLLLLGHLKPFGNFSSQFTNFTWLTFKTNPVIQSSCLDQNITSWAQYAKTTTKNTLAPTQHPVRCSTMAVSFILFYFIILIFWIFFFSRVTETNTESEQEKKKRCWLQLEWNIIMQQHFWPLNVISSRV